jgi:hypothetical protein
MDFYLASNWRPPTQSTKTIKSANAPKLKKSTITMAKPQKHVTLQTISEDRPLKAIKAAPDTAQISQLSKENAALRKQCASLEAQRNEVFQDLDELASATAQPQPPQKTQPQPQNDAHIAKITELETNKRVLEERCKQFSAWAEKHRLESSKHAADCQRHIETCNSLSDALSEFCAKHNKLHAQHQDLDAQLTALKASMAQRQQTTAAAPPYPNTDFSARIEAIRAEVAEELKTAKAKTLEAQTRTINAEKTVQTLLGVQTLIRSAPVAPELSVKTRSILQSVIEILNLANQPGAPATIQACLTQVCSALADLGDEAADHSKLATGWLTKRDSVLRSIR